MHSFIVHAHVGDTLTLGARWVAPVIPQIGDTLILPDGSPDGQDVEILERVIRHDVVEVWVGTFTNWQPEDAAALFDRMRELVAPS